MHRAGAARPQEPMFSISLDTIMMVFPALAIGGIALAVYLWMNQGE